MNTRVQKWGNSLAVRIPKSFAFQAGLQENATVALSLVDGRLLIEPIVAGGLSLTQLLDVMTEQNLHTEVETGPAVGNEAW